MIRRPPRSTLDRSSAASDVYKRQVQAKAIDTEQLVIRQQVRGRGRVGGGLVDQDFVGNRFACGSVHDDKDREAEDLSLIHISEPTRPY